jgi:cyclic pyranopterin phosphate synthase
MALALPILQDAPQRPIYAQGPRSLAAVKLLRISVTDRCNLRCVYCMPAGGVAFEDQHDLLSAEDFITVAKAARSVGVDHFKVTGGEPTVRHDVVAIVYGLAKLQPRDLSLTTNGLLLDRLATNLRKAGLNRITLSWDSMIPQRFDRITRGDRAGREATGNSYEKFQRGLEAALRAGFTKLKINVVVIGGVNDDEVANFARLTLEYPWTVRFIEYMPLGDSVLLDDASASGGGLADGSGYLVDNAIVRQRIESELGPMSAIPRETEAGVGPANVFELPNAKGRIGFISAMSKPFCETCNRLRLTATGELRSCLFDGGEVSVLPALRPTPDPAMIIDMMRRCVAMKPETHSHRGNRAMSQMGG